MEYRPPRALLEVDMLITRSAGEESWEQHARFLDWTATDRAYKRARGEDLYTEAWIRFKPTPRSRIVAYGPGLPDSPDFHCYLSDEGASSSPARVDLSMTGENATVQASRLVRPKTNRDLPQEYPWHRLAYLVHREWVPGGADAKVLRWFWGDEIPHFKFPGVPEPMKSPIKKFCKKCGALKSVDDFRFVRSRGRRHSQCRDCESAARKKRRVESPEAVPMSQDDFEALMDRYGERIDNYVLAKSLRETKVPEWQIEIREEAWDSIRHAEPGREYEYYAQIIKRAAWRARKRLERAAREQYMNELMYLYIPNADVIVNASTGRLVWFRSLGAQTPRAPNYDR